MRRVAGAVLLGFSLVAVVLARVGTRALAEHQLQMVNWGPGNPMSYYLPTFDVLLLYGAVLADIALLAWPERQK